MLGLGRVRVRKQISSGLDLRSLHKAPITCRVFYSRLEIQPPRTVCWSLCELFHNLSPVLKCTRVLPLIMYPGGQWSSWEVAPGNGFVYGAATTRVPVGMRGKLGKDGAVFLVLAASRHARLLIGSQGPQKRAGGINDNCSRGLPTRCACSPAARSPLASVLPTPSLPPCWPEMAVAIATLLIQSEDNEANVFFIPMS